MDGWLKGKKRQKRYKDAQGRKKEKMDKENGKKKKTKTPTTSDSTTGNKNVFAGSMNGVKTGLP